jgi:acyl-coenzyme A synthetase/AMP-(fatty) acid ligase
MSNFSESDYLEDVTFVYMDKLLDYPSFELKPHNLSQQNLCYVTYTSGSTGKPKGVLVEHNQLRLYVSQGLIDLIGDKQWFLHSSNATFDILAHEVYMPLVAGRSVLIVENLMWNTPSHLLQNIGFVQGPTTLLENTPFKFQEDCFVSQIGEKLTKTALAKYGKICK